MTRGRGHAFQVLVRGRGAGRVGPHSAAHLGTGRKSTVAVVCGVAICSHSAGRLCPGGQQVPGQRGWLSWPVSRALGRGTCRLTHAHLWWLRLVLWPLTGRPPQPLLWSGLLSVAALMSVPSLRLQGADTGHSSGPGRCSGPSRDNPLWSGISVAVGARRDGLCAGPAISLWKTGPRDLSREGRR